MTATPPLGTLADRALEVLGSNRMTQVISVTAIGLALTARLSRSLMGWPALIAALALLVVIASVSLFARRRELEWRGLLPVSLLAFVGWCVASVFWSDTGWASLGSVLYQVGICVLGIYIALTRDLIQIIRSVGDVIRFSLVLSLAIEIFAGLLIDQPIRFLGIEGNLGTGSPIQGIFGARNMLGLVALIGLITFTAEFLTRSVTKTLGVFSLSLSVIALLLTRSPVVTGVTVVAVLAAAAMYGLRQLSPSARRIAQWSLAALVFLGIVIGWGFRTRIIAALNAGSEFEVRYTLWQQVLRFFSLRPIEGWGWSGIWRPELQPYLAVDVAVGRQHASALNAFVDVLFQVGLVGAFLFVVLVGLSVTRSWLLAANQRSVVYVWPAIVLIALLVTSLAESTILVEFGWLIFVMCSVAAAHRLSWRRNYDPEKP